MTQVYELTSEGLCILTMEPCDVPQCDCEACGLYTEYRVDEATRYALWGW